MAVENNKNLRKKTKLEKTDAQQNQDISRMECKKHQSKNECLCWF